MSSSFLYLLSSSFSPGSVAANWLVWCTRLWLRGTIFLIWRAQFSRPSSARHTNYDWSHCCSFSIMFNSRAPMQIDTRPYIYRVKASSLDQLSPRWQTLSCFKCRNFFGVGAVFAARAPPRELFVSPAPRGESFNQVSRSPKWTSTCLLINSFWPLGKMVLLIMWLSSFRFPWVRNAFFLKSAVQYIGSKLNKWLAMGNFSVLDWLMVIKYKPLKEN